MSIIVELYSDNFESQINYLLGTNIPIKIQYLSILIKNKYFMYGNELSKILNENKYNHVC